MKRNSFNLILKLVLIQAFCCSALSLNGQTEQQQDLRQYLFDSFTKSTVITRAGIEKHLLLNYNMVSEKMVFEQKGEYFDLLNPETVDTVYIRSFKFIPREDFYLEVLATGKYSMFIQHKAELKAPPRPMGYGTTNELTSSNLQSGYSLGEKYYNLKLPEGYTVRPSRVFWLKTGDDWVKFNGPAFLPKLIPGKEDVLKKFIKDNKIKGDRREDMVKLAAFCNTL